MSNQPQLSRIDFLKSEVKVMASTCALLGAGVKQLTTIINIIRNTHARGITTCAHLILGLPDEDEEEILSQVDIVNSLPIDILKLHQLQITRGTLLEKDVNLQKRCTLFSPEEYIQLIGKYIKKLRPEIVLERFTSQSPSDLLIAPRWGLKNYEFTNLLNNRLKSH